MRYLEETIDMGAGPRRFRAYVPDGTERAFYKGHRPAVVIFPGGGYGMTYEGEAEPIALAFTAQGICAFVLDYTTTEHAEKAYPYAILEAFAAIRSVRERAEEFGIDPHNIASLGFSAGGHLCGCTGTLWNKPEMVKGLGDLGAASRPDKMVLCYPVIRGNAPCHRGSFENLLGKDVTDEVCEEWSLQNRVDAGTPPSFIWATSEDYGVPIQGALEFSHRLADLDIRQELHIYTHGWHGTCLGNQVTEAMAYGNDWALAAWLPDAVRFLYDESLIR